MSAARIGLLALLTLPCVLLYARVTGAFFCSFDDFDELRRAAFEDAREPLKMFTTGHSSEKYRPLNRAVNYLTYRYGGLRALPFRARNLIFHLANVVLVYFLGVALFSSSRAGALAALLFGVHPLANMSLVGAVVTNPLAYFFVLSACLVCIAATKDGRFRPASLSLGLSLGCLGLLTYDLAVVVFPLVWLILLLRKVVLPVGPDRRSLLLVAAGTVASTAAYLVLRLLFVRSGFGRAAENLPTLGRVGKDTALYAAALMNPIDPVLANAAIGIPFPSEMNFGGRSFLLAALAFGALGFTILLVGSKWLVRRGLRLRGADLVAVLFLLVGIVLELIPALVFARRPSETYLYLPAAFMSLLFGFLVVQFHAAAGDRLKPVVVVMACGILALYAAATWVRNGLVVRCGATAERILAGIPCPEANMEARTIQVSSMPGSGSKKFGFYGFRGTDTIGDGSHASPALTAALQLFCNDEGVEGAVLTPEQLRESCGTTTSGGVLDRLWVDPDGRISACEALGR